jgi:CheY-like chemotaxis protein
VEIGTLIICMMVVVVVKSLTTVSLGNHRNSIKDAESVESEVARKLSAVEDKRLQLERDDSTLEREEKLLVNEKDLLLIQIKKLGEEPIPEDELDVIEAGKNGSSANSSNAGDPDQDKSEESLAKRPGPNHANTNPELLRILVVDDNTELREVLDEALSRDYTVTEAIDGLDALAKILREHLEFDLIITDLKMPNVNGITFIEHLPEPVPTIIISGFLESPHFQEALGRLNPYAILQKPFQLTELRQAVDTAAREILSTNGKTAA